MLDVFSKLLYFCHVILNMKTRSEYISIIESFSDVIKSQFGVTSLRLFGSVARDEHTMTSDVDVCVVMKPNMIQRIQLKHFLENLLGCSVDIIREHKNMNETLKREIERDGIEIFTERCHGRQGYNSTSLF